MYFEDGLPLKRIAAVIVGAVIVILAYSLGSEIGEPFTTKSSGNNNSIETLQPYANLDLRVAGTAVYNDGPIKKLTNLGPDHKANRQLFSFAVPADHLTEYGLLTTPQTPPPPGGYPVVILIHGFIVPSAYSTKKAYLSDMEWYSRHGFAVLKPDLRGQGLSIHAGQPEGAYYSMAYNTDVLSLISAVQNTAGLNAGNITLWGHSMGAYIALRAAVLSPAVRTVILLSAPAGYVQDMYQDFKPRSDYANPAALKIRKQVLKENGNPLNNPTFWNYTSPLNFLADTRAYIQIHVGAKDTVVPTKFSADLNSALNELQLPHAYYIYPNGDHGMLSVRGQVYTRSLQAIER